MMRRLLLAAAIMDCVATAAPQRAYAQTNSAADIRIDAVTGQVVGGRQYGTRAVVTFVIENVNPFVYQYRIVMKTTTYTEGAIAEFAKAGFGVALTLPSYATKSTVEPLTGPPGHLLAVQEAVDPACLGDYNKKPEAMAAAVGLELDTDSLIKLDTAILHGLKSIDSELATWTARFREPREVLRRADARTAALRTAVQALDTALAEYTRDVVPEHQRFADRASGYMGWVAQYIDQTSKFETSYPPCQYFHVRRADASRWAFDTVIVRGSLTRLRQGDSALALEAQQVARVARDIDLWQIRRQVSGGEDPSSINVTVQRAAVGTDTAWRTVANPTIWFGRRRFGLGVGLLFSRFESFEYSAVKQYPTTGDTTGDTVQTVVVETGRSLRRVSPSIFLSARLTGGLWHLVDGFHVVVSSGPDKDQGDLSLAYFVGAAVSALDERLFLAVGEVSSTEHTLGGGLVPGGRIPDGQAVPTYTHRRWRLGFGLSFRAF